MAINGQGIP